MSSRFNQGRSGAKGAIPKKNGIKKEANDTITSILCASNCCQTRTSGLVGIEMTIHSETLRRLRKRAGLSQQDLADRSGVSKRTIARLEQGVGEGGNRNHTVNCLARALKVSTDVLSVPLAGDEIDSVSVNMQRVMTFVSPHTLLDFDMVKERYGVGIDALVAAAPWMFALMAEMSLADRRERLARAREAMARMQATASVHLGLATDLPVGLAERFEREAASVNAGDVFGILLPEPDGWPEVEDMPFTSVLAEKARGLASSLVDPAEMDTEIGDPLPIWSIHTAWLEAWVGGDRVAKYALLSGLARVADIPEDLRSAEEMTERVAFLRKLVPQKDHKRIEQNEFILGEIK
ncbi:MAG: helix-turn-helix domain-containing protein [Alphaproteobacteria bacterium]